MSLASCLVKIVQSIRHTANSSHVTSWSSDELTGSSVSYPSGVRGEAPAAKRFWRILSSKRDWRQQFWLFIFI